MLQAMINEIKNLNKDQQLLFLLELLEILEKSSLPKDDSKEGSILLTNKTIPTSSELWKTILQIEILCNNLLNVSTKDPLIVRVLNRYGYHYDPPAKLHTSKGYFVF
jgi:hypothetical protein